jgi:hypothetical protein
MKTAVMLAAVFLANAAFAQGTINGSNAGPFGARPLYYTLPSSPPVYKPTDASTRVEILAGASADTLSLLAVGGIVAQGLFALGVLNVPDVAPGGIAFVVVRFWDQTTGGSYDSAFLKTQTAPFTVVTGGAGSPPSTPGNFANMPQTGPIPEPGTTALAMLGLVAFLAGHRPTGGRRNRGEGRL